MKDIKTFITESMSALKLKNVRVIYRVIPDIFTVGVPNNYLDQIRTAYMLYISKKKLQKNFK